MSLNLASFANYVGDEENIASSSDAPEEPLPVGIRVKNEFAEPEESSARFLFDFNIFQSE